MKFLFDDLPNKLDPIHINTDYIFRGRAVTKDPVFKKGITRFSKQYGNDFSVAYTNVVFKPIDIIGNTFKISDGYNTDFQINDLITYYDNIAEITNIVKDTFTLDRNITTDITTLTRAAVKLDVSYFDSTKILVNALDYKISSFDILVNWNGTRINPFTISDISLSSDTYEIITDINTDQVWLLTYPLYEADILLKQPLYCSFFDIMQKETQDKDFFRVTVKDAGSNILEVLNNRWEVLLGDITFKHLALWDIVSGSIKISDTRLHLYTNDAGYFELNTALTPSWLKTNIYSWIFSITNNDPFLANLIIEINDKTIYNIIPGINHLQVDLLPNIEATKFSIKIKGSPNSHYELSGFDLLTLPNSITVEASIHNYNWWFTGLLQKPYFLQYDKKLEFKTNQGNLI